MHPWAEESSSTPVVVRRCLLVSVNACPGGRGVSPWSLRVTVGRGSHPVVAVVAVEVTMAGTSIPATALLTTTIPVERTPRTLLA